MPITRELEMYFTYVMCHNIHTYIHTARGSPVWPSLFNGSSPCDSLLIANDRRSDICFIRTWLEWLMRRSPCGGVLTISPSRKSVFRRRWSGQETRIAETNCAATVPRQWIQAPPSLPSTFGSLAVFFIFLLSSSLGSTS